jgi:hypothetical protein
MREGSKLGTLTNQQPPVVPAAHAPGNEVLKRYGLPPGMHLDVPKSLIEGEEDAWQIWLTKNERMEQRTKTARTY